MYCPELSLLARLQIFHMLLATFSQDEHSPKGSKEFFLTQSQFPSGTVVKKIRLPMQETLTRDVGLISG